MIPEWHDTGFTGICGGLFGRIVGRFQFMRNSCKKSNNNAKGQTDGMTNQRRKSLETLIHP